MSNKRNSTENLKSYKKKLVSATEDELSDSEEIGQILEETDFSIICSDTEAAIIFIKNLLTVKNKINSFPPVVFVHQVYDVIECKTTVNRQIEFLRNDKKLVLIHLGNEENMKIVVLFEDFKNHVLQDQTLPTKLIYQKFFDKILANITDIGISKVDLLIKHRFSEVDIRMLVNAGLLILKETGIFWFSFPSAGIFMKKLIKGRNLLLKLIKQRKYHEILQTELQRKTIEKSLDLPLKYHIHDLVGGKFVKCFKTSSGRLLRIKNKT